MGKFIGKLKAFSFLGTWRACRQCGKKVQSRSNGMVQCPNCGYMSYKKSKRIWAARATFDIFDTDVMTLMTEKQIEQLILPAGLSWCRYMDSLKGLRQQAWLETYKSIKNQIETSVNSHLSGKVLSFNAKKYDKDTLLITKIGQSYETTRIPETGTKFVQGNLKELGEVTQNVLQSYNQDLEWWEETPVLVFKKIIQYVTVEIGLRAPLQEYGKSYRVWMRANGTHMYPSKAVRTAKEQFEWVMRIYHTRGWSERLKETLEYCISLEERLIAVIKAAERIEVNALNENIKDLPVDTREEISSRWHGGNLWNLVQLAGGIDRAAGIAILKKHKLLPDDTF